MLFQGQSPGEGWGNLDTHKKKVECQRKGVKRENEKREISVCWSVP